MTRAAIYPLFLLSIFLSGLAPASDLAGVAERISDGDTMRIKAPDGTKTKIRLAGIDAPEKSQPFGRAAGRRLAALCYGKNVEADFRDFDRFKRTVARVRCGDIDVGRLLIDEGLAWHYLKYAKTQPVDEASRDAAGEVAARANGKGLWSDSNPMAPWDYRKEARAARANK
jgi:micrococcal nuclease